jgi:hypothetical protein
MIYDYDKDGIKNSLTIEQVNELVAELGGEPQIQGNSIISRTICHGGDSRKLYYYDNTKLFSCYTGCEERTFDIFQLVLKVKTRELMEEWELPQAIRYVAQYFGYSPNEKNEDFTSTLEDWKILNNWSIYD